jgi:hypothetical protein
MNDQNENNSPQTAPYRLPLWLQCLGVLVFVGSVILSARIIWEQTVWTWQRGPQMIGFSLAHGPGTILLMFPFLLFLWTVIALVLTLLRKVKRRQISPRTWAALGAAVLLLVLTALPEGFWQRIFIRRMAASSHAGDLLVYAAYRCDLGTVRAFISHGVGVDAIEHASWRTALHGATVCGDTRTLNYLLSQGADINAVDRYGDSPLELAASRGNHEAVQFLTTRGAKAIKGAEAQRKKAINDQVLDDIREMNRAGESPTP